MVFPVIVAFASPFHAAAAVSSALAALAMLAFFALASARSGARPLLAPVFLASLAFVFLLRYPPERVRGADPDWKASGLVDEMLERTRLGPPLRFAVIPRLSEFQPGLLLLECARRRVPADRALANGIWKAGQWGNLTDAEFIVTGAGGGAVELPWQAFLRGSLEAPESGLGRNYERASEVALPDGMRITLWQRRAP